MTDKPLDCIGITAEIGKHDYREHDDPLTIAKEVLGNRLRSVFNLSDPPTLRCYLLDGTEATREQVIEAANLCLISKGGDPLPIGAESK